MRDIQKAWTDDAAQSLANAIDMNLMDSVLKSNEAFSHSPSTVISLLTSHTGNQTDE